MRDKRYPAFLLVSAVLLSAFLISYSGHFSKKAYNPSIDQEKPSPTTPSPSALPDGQAMAQPKNILPVFPLDINRATVEDLMLLPGIGEKTARRIVEKRAELNGFRRVDDLTEVKWVGKVKLEKIRGLVVAGPSADGSGQPSR
ncbi:MAG TPA: hypothetical protein DDW94_10035 [Deltaproteobacteria bacterium]|nr:MAG: hypothetical protein A2Z79_12630 [Deltaproteobacteria bacterium GWA2_55_82]OGQ64012.1 MAG: hypothetical protein A3I81_08160 [Deltaproteobacteria bacterium RIFCSPLOWO2_02_FULL_55_12]OIJ73446.1 MAG: hypothetical protein A2V21_303700 [Deltaproteobacteria bacterium GWC2_55_46]HBG47310.1 hypothetical protein [Deltaproteobacteria bacterium]HCY10076.1 hypothetical protein [Deltaproteobacteria bacterium]